MDVRGVADGNLAQQDVLDLARSYSFKQTKRVT